MKASDLVNSLDVQEFGVGKYVVKWAREGESGPGRGDVNLGGTLGIGFGFGLGLGLGLRFGFGFGWVWV